MRRLVFATLFVLPSLLLLAPSAQSAALLDIDDVDVQERDDGQCTEFAVKNPLRFLAIVKNVGDANFSGLAVVEFVLSTPDDAGYLEQSVNKTLILAPGESETFEYVWYPEEKQDDFTLAATMGGRNATADTVSFAVGDVCAFRGSVVDYLVRYSWVYAAVLVAVVLYIAVVRVRKPPRP